METIKLKKVIEGTLRDFELKPIKNYFNRYTLYQAYLEGRPVYKTCYNQETLDRIIKKNIIMEETYDTQD